jgi:TM2 domain-containing membrane protein YozV
MRIPPTLLCPQCGFQNPKAYNFCADCGKKLHSRESTPDDDRQSVFVLAPLSERSGADNRKSRGIYITLCLFFGWIGIHNFYARRIYYGLAQLLITLFTFRLIYPVFAVSLWAIFELFNVNTDGKGVKMR